MTTRRAQRGIVFGCVLLLQLAAATTYAVDGVIEINQARALAGSVTTGDAPGFPVEIKSPGSYRLTGNLDLTATPPGLAHPENTTAIQVTADDVTIDLNGFMIKGPTACSGPPLMCSPTGSGVGIDASGQTGVGVMNGTVRGMGSNGVFLSSQSQAEKVRALSNGGFGIIARTVANSTASGNGVIGISAEATVVNCTADRNGTTGISATTGGTGTVANCTADSNGTSGIDATTVANSTAHANGTNGISANTVANCTASGNGGTGISASAAIGCTASLNGGSQIIAPGIVGHNICGPGFTPCPP